MLMRMPGSYCIRVTNHQHDDSDKPTNSTHAGVDSGDGDKRAGCATAAVGDVNLSATDVELGAAVCGCDVESNLTMATQLKVSHPSIKRRADVNR